MLASMNSQHDNLGIRDPKIDRIRELGQYSSTGRDSLTKLSPQARAS